MAITRAELVEYILESNAIEHVYGDKATEKSLKAWEFLSGKEQLTVEDILETHRIAFTGVIDVDRMPGKFRDHQVYVGSWVAPNWQEVPKLVEDWIGKNGTGYLLGQGCDVCEHTRTEVLSAHLDFEDIHPFSDGNGRLGRLLMLWMTEKAGLEPILFKNKDKHKLYYPLFTMRREMRLL